MIGRRMRLRGNAGRVRRGGPAIQAKGRHQGVKFVDGAGLRRCPVFLLGKVLANFCGTELKGLVVTVCERVVQSELEVDSLARLAFQDVGVGGDHDGWWL